MTIDFNSLTPGKQKQWLTLQPAPKTKEEVKQHKRVKRLIQLAKDEENE